MLKDIGNAAMRSLGYLAQAPLRAFNDGSPQDVALDIAVKLTDRDYAPVGGVTVRLFAGRGDQSDPEAGATVTTGPNGEARFTTPAVIDKQWLWVNIGFTGLSAPHLADHLSVATELDNVIPGEEGEIHLPLLCTMDIYRLPDGDCASRDFTRIYAKDDRGRFTRGVDPDRIDIETPKGRRVLSGICYRVASFLIAPVSPARWRLELALIQSRLTRYP